LDFEDDDIQLENIQSLRDLSNLSNTYPTDIQLIQPNRAENIQHGLSNLDKDIQLFAKKEPAPEPLGCGTYELDVKKAAREDVPKTVYSVPSQALIHATKNLKSKQNMLSKALSLNDIARAESLRGNIEIIKTQIEDIRSQLGVSNIQKYIAEQKKGGA